jgi:hypothetical protein
MLGEWGLDVGRVGLQSCSVKSSGIKGIEFWDSVTKDSLCTHMRNFAIIYY